MEHAEASELLLTFLMRRCARAGTTTASTTAGTSAAPARGRPKSVFRFKEEAITDLLIGTRGQGIECGRCPVCGPDRRCSDSDGDPVRRWVDADPA